MCRFTSIGSEVLSDLQTDIKRNQTREDLEGGNSRQRKKCAEAFIRKKAWLVLETENISV